MDSRSISVIVPVFNSAELLRPLVRRLQTALDKQKRQYEIILVNDGSSDTSWEKISALQKEIHQIRGINLMRNYGQHNALLCGIRAASGATIVTVDDDLQHPPEEIAKLLHRLDEGYDVVYGVPHSLPHSWWRNSLSRIIKVGLAHVMGIGDIRDISAFRAFRTDLRCAFADYRGPTVLLDVLLSWGTRRFAAERVEHHPRRIGKSNYSFGKLFNQTMLILTGYSTAPLRLASMVGFGFTLFGLLIFTYVLGNYFFVRSLPGFPFLASIIALFSGAQLFALGIIGEYLARIFNRSMERPTYIVAFNSSDANSSIEPILPLSSARG